MRHHLDRAARVYKDKGLIGLAITAAKYIPIEINNSIFRLRHGSGTQVMQEDWDTLIILDGCRYDMFAEHVPFDGQLCSRISLGSTSEEFLRQNFSNGQYHDTVYVNSNVYFPKVGLDQDETFHAVVDLLDEWDDDLEIALPETVTETARKAHNEFPNKRIIVHYMQPHIPFITDRGQEIQKRIGNRNAWVPFRNGQNPVSMEELWEGYNENLKLVLDHVSDLLPDIDGKVVISADHGNMVGERLGLIPTKRFYGHPWGVYTKELVKVPWFVIPAEERRTITSDQPITGDAYSEELVMKRLRSLGYRE